MANPRSRRRGSESRHRRTEHSGRLDLRVTGDEPEPERPTPGIWWPLAAAGGALVSALTGWLLVTALLLVGWVSASDLQFAEVLVAGTRIWLLGYFSGATLAGVHLTIAPLGLTAIAALVCSGTAGFAAAMARRDAPEEISARERRAIVLRVAAVFAAVHAVAVLVASFFASTPDESARALIGALVVSAVSAVVGAARVCQWHPLLDLPVWARAVPRAVAAAVLTMVASGAVVLAVQLWRSRKAVTALHEALDAGASGGVLLLIVQLLWLPNVVIWCAAWAVGAGFSLGAGTMVTPSVTEVGLLPAIPIFGAVPANGTGTGAGLWWLLSAALAGCAAAVVVLRARRRARVDETALVGGLSGVLSGLVLTAVAALSGGDLGSGRLVGLGPRIPQLVVMAPTLMGIAGVAAGFAMGLLRPVREHEVADTIPVDRGEPVADRRR